MSQLIVIPQSASQEQTNPWYEDAITDVTLAVTHGNVGVAKAFMLAFNPNVVKAYSEDIAAADAQREANYIARLKRR